MPRRRIHKDQRQESFSFERPAPPPSGPPPARRKFRRGRIRDAFRQGLVILMIASVPAFAWAWHKGHVQDTGKTLQEKVVQASLDAGLELGRIRARGQIKTTDDALLEALGLQPGAPLLMLDMGLLRTQVEKLPWVRKAVITRELPDTLKIWIEERVPFARWQYRGGMQLVDREGVAIPGADISEYLHLPLVVGVGAPEEAPNLFALLYDHPDLAERVVAAIRIGERRWDLEFDSGARLKLPEMGIDYGPAQAWEAFVAMEKEKNVLRLEVMSLDLRLPDRVVLKLTPEGRKTFAQNDVET